MTEAQFNPDFSAGEPEKVRMRFGVIANEVSSRGSFLNELWTFAHVSPNHEKCCLCIVAVEKVKKFRRDRWVRPIVKRDR